MLYRWDENNFEWAINSKTRTDSGWTIGFGTRYIYQNNSSTYDITTDGYFTSNVPLIKYGYGGNYAAPNTIRFNGAPVYVFSMGSNEETAPTSIKVETLYEVPSGGFMQFSKGGSYVAFNLSVSLGNNPLNVLTTQPQKTTFNQYVYSIDQSVYPNGGVSGNYWYVC